MTVHAKLVDMISEFKQFRRDLHIHPELSFEENRTAMLISEKLTEYGIKTSTGIAGTGVVGVLKRGNGKKVIGLRADTDALPIHEQNKFAHASQFPGKMHACGHDGHTSMLLMAAKYLGLYGNFNGTVVFLFQPAEEIGQGAKKMLDEGLFTRFPLDAVFGLHNIAEIPAGDLGVIPGAITAGSSVFKITIKGAGGHAAMPHNGRDPLFTAMQIANALQGIISREKNPLDCAVLSISEFHSGNTMNVMPDDAWLAGAVRTFNNDITDLIERRMRSIVENISMAFGCKAEVYFERFCPPVINTKAQTEFAISVMKQVAGENRVHTDLAPTMASEDFAFFLRDTPGCYANIGNGSGEHREEPHGDGPCIVHNPGYDFNDNILYTGADYWVTLAENYLVTDE